MFSNLSLLPHDASIVVKDITKKLRYIQLMKELLKEFKEALYYFENKELSRFDAQVGETLCQIRAYKIYSLSVALLPDFKSSLLSLKETLDRIINKLDLHECDYQIFLKTPKKERPYYTDSAITLTDFFLSMDCLFNLSEDAFFLFLSYFLCKYHVLSHENIPMAINFIAIAERLTLSIGYSKKVGQFYQKMLSELSCNYIFQLLDELPDNSNLKLILPWLFRKSDEGRVVLPCYPVTEIIIHHMIEKNADVILLIDLQDEYHKERLALRFQGHKKRFDLCFPLKNESNVPCVVFWGTCLMKKIHSKKEIIENLLSIGLKNAVLYNNSAHPQYSGYSLVAFRKDPFQALITEQGENLSIFEIEIAKELSGQLSNRQLLAEQNGFTITNQGLFFLKHIFCDIAQTHSNDYISTVNLLRETVFYEASGL